MVTEKLKKKDVVLFRTNQLSLHINEMFGGCDYDPSSIEPEEYIGWAPAGQ